jgi:hypothetical protein
MICVALCLSILACGRKGDPVPRTRATPSACSARWSAHRILEVRLPRSDARNEDLVGIEKVRVFYLPLGSARPSAAEVLAKGEVVLERSRPDLPGPGGTVRMDLRQIGRPAGWMIATAVRVGDVIGAPSEPVPWLDPAI